MTGSRRAGVTMGRIRAWQSAICKIVLCVPSALRWRQTCRRGHALGVHAGRTLAMTAAAVVSGCAVGPDFAAPAVPDVAGYTPGRQPERTAAAGIAGGEAQRFHIGRDIPGDWWRLFRSRPLTTLVELALRNNPNLEAAQAALRVAQANVAVG